MEGVRAARCGRLVLLLLGGCRCSPSLIVFHKRFLGLNRWVAMEFWGSIPLYLVFLEGCSSTPC